MSQNANETWRHGVVLFVVAVAIGTAVTLVLSYCAHVQAHDIYTGLRSPKGTDCCGGQDCRPAQVVLDGNGELQILDGDKRWMALDPRWYIGPSMDGSWHICRPQSWQVPVCTIGGEGT